MEQRSDLIWLNVSGKKFCVMKELLTSGTFFAALLDPANPMKTNFDDKGRLYIGLSSFFSFFLLSLIHQRSGRNPKLFSLVVNYLQYGKYNLSLVPGVKVCCSSSLFVPSLFVYFFFGRKKWC